MILENTVSSTKFTIVPQCLGNQFTPAQSNSKGGPGNKDSGHKYHKYVGGNYVPTKKVSHLYNTEVIYKVCRSSNT